MIGFAAEPSMQFEVQSLTGAAQTKRSFECINSRTASANKNASTKAHMGRIWIA